MEYPRLGGSGLVVSRVVLGCMGFGDPNRGNHTWSIGPDEARPLIRSAIESGITTFDTANVYSLGSSEEIVGQALGEFARRDEVLIATKVHGRMGPGPNGGGLSRAAIMTQVDESLRRLRTDYIDLYQIHRYDAAVPGGGDDGGAARPGAGREGPLPRRVLDVGLAVREAAARRRPARLDPLRGDAGPVQPADARGGAGDAAVLPRQGVGVIPWSPLARGRLTRDWEETTERSTTDRFGGSLYRQAEENDRKIVEAVTAVARERDVTRAQVALAWVLHRPGVTAPIVGVTRGST